MKSRFLYTAGGALCLLAQSSCSHADQPGVHPNVIYVFPDQMRNHALGFWREEGFREAVNFVSDPVYTPNLNQFAREAIVLTHAYSNFPVSSPHRGMLLTGMFSENSGVPLNCNSNRPVSNLREDAICIGDVFSHAGYSCAYIGKLHVDYPTPNDPANPGHYVENTNPVWDAYTPPERRHGFDFWYSYGTFDVHKSPHYWDTNGLRHDIKEWSPIHETNMAISYIRNEGGVRDANKPFFMMISYNPPHSPYDSLDDCLEEDYNLYKDIPTDSLLIRPNVDRSMAKSASVPYYFASITGVDREFGRLLAVLKEMGLDENTIIVFSSDHGETMCSHSLMDPKNSPYAESMNVPFIVRYPEVLKPRIDTTLILSTPDVMPTLLGLSGLEKLIPASVEGRNYADWFKLEEESVPLRKGALYLRNGDGPKDEEGKVHSYVPVARGIKTDRYTLCFSLHRETLELRDILFFDDLTDPYQMNNLSIEEHQEIVSELCAEMASLLEEAHDPWYKEKILETLIPYTN